MASNQKQGAAAKDQLAPERIKRINTLIDSYQHGFSNNSPRTQEELEEIRSLFEYELSRDPVDSPEAPPP
jgi:hypothetical protein